ncbi:MAG: TauD/TfdA family dioxygenase, partial [Myxococcales bacterium]|nr:TauD/TfdA family dioxygenase [Myxococcales bacterium]
MAALRSVTARTLDYFARPHESVRRTPVEGAAVWTGPECAARDDWWERLTPEDLKEIDAALSVAKRTGKPMERLGREDFPLPALATKIARWASEVDRGRGFQVIRGVPVERWSEADATLFYWGFGLHMGLPAEQSRLHDLVGHVRNEGVNPNDPDVRAYRTAEHIAFHCDAADVVGLLCLRTAKHGGRSLIASSATIYNRLLAERPDLVGRLYRPMYLDTRGDGGVYYIAVTPCRHADGVLRTFWHSDYFRTAERYARVPRFDALTRELLDRYDALAADPSIHFAMDLEPGDIQLLSNHTVIHARTAYEDWPEPER